MPDIVGIVTKSHIRIDKGANAERTTTVDRERKGHEDVKLEEALSGVLVRRRSGFFALIPWGNIAEVFYADTTELPGLAKAK